MFVLLCVILIAGFGVWRLSYAPLNIEFAKSFVEDSLAEAETDIRVSFGKLNLHWPNLGEPIMLQAKDVSVVNNSDTQLLQVGSAQIGLEATSLMIGRIVPREITIENPSLFVTRNGVSDFDFGFAMPEKKAKADVEKMDNQSFLKELVDILYRDDVGTSASSLSELATFRVVDASIRVEDNVLNFSWLMPSANLSFSKDDAGLRIDADVQLPFEAQGRSAKFRLGALLDRHSRMIDFGADLQDFSPQILAELMPDLEILAEQRFLFNAKLNGMLDEELAVRRLVFDLSSDQGELNIESLSDDAVPLSDITLKAHYDNASRFITFSNFGATIGKVSFMSSAELVYNDGEVRGPFRLDIEKVHHDDIKPIWPAALEGDNSEEWVIHKLSKGLFQNLYTQADLVLKRNEDGWDGDVERLVAGFEFEDLDVNYREPLWPITDASGNGRFDLDTQTLRINVDDAKLREMSITKGELEFIDIIRVGAGTADINVELNGPLKNTLSYVAVEPIGVKPDFMIDGVSGHADLKVNVQFPTVSDIPKEAVKIDVLGKLSDVVIPNVVKGLGLSKASLDAKVKDGQFSVKGNGLLDGRKTILEYDAFLSPKGKAFSSRVKAKLTADEELRKKFGIDLSLFMSGPTGVDVTYTSKGSGNAVIDVNADLSQSLLYFEPFKYVKASGRGAQAVLKAQMSGGELKRVYDLNGSAPDVKISNAEIDFRGGGDETEVSGGMLPSFTIGETRAKAEFEIGSNNRMKIIMSGPFLDMRPFLDNSETKKEAYEGPSVMMSIDVLKARTSDTETIDAAKMYVDIDHLGKFNQLEMDANIGAGDLYLRFKPDETGKRTFHFEADDAGAVLKAFGLYKGMRGGSMKIYAKPVRSVYDRNLVGRAEIENFRVVDAPGLARLLSAMSLSGLEQTLDGKDGLGFSRMQAEFDWLYRYNGSLLVLKNGRTSGNSLGLTFDGTFDNAKQKLDVEGTVIPLSGINDVIGSIPLLGDIITGGTGALIAATYTMKSDGPGKEPIVSVNPLSVLTPGILRRVLFEE